MVGREAAEGSLGREGEFGTRIRAAGAHRVERANVWPAGEEKVGQNASRAFMQANRSSRRKRCRKCIDTCSDAVPVAVPGA